MRDSHPTGGMIVALKLFSLIVLLMPSQAVAESLESTHSENRKNKTVSDAIHFIALPYLNAFHVDQNNQPDILRHDKNQSDLSDYQWMVSTTSIPEFSHKHGMLDILDSNQHSGYRLTTNLHNMIIPIQTMRTLSLPLHQNDTDSSPLWLRYSKTDRTTWHAPNLTPAVKARIIADNKRAAQQAERLAKRMADRAFYFGYDTNDDALK